MPLREGFRGPHFMTMSPSPRPNTSRAQVTVVLGDIVRQLDCDAIVNSANEYLIAGGGVCGAIYRAAGRELEPYTRRLAPLELGEAVISPGFQVSARWIIHTRGPKYHEDPNSAQHLAKALESAIRLADQNQIMRLAVPAISMGIYSYPAEEAVPILVQTAINLCSMVTHLQEIRFVLFEVHLCDLFERILRGFLEPVGDRAASK